MRTRATSRRQRLRRESGPIACEIGVKRASFGGAPLRKYERAFWGAPSKVRLAAGKPPTARLAAAALGSRSAVHLWYELISKLDDFHPQDAYTPRKVELDVANGVHHTPIVAVSDFVAKRRATCLRGGGVARVASASADACSKHGMRASTALRHGKQASPCRTAVALSPKEEVDLTPHDEAQPKVEPVHDVPRVLHVPVERRQERR